MVSCAIAYGFIPKYSCGNDAAGNPLKACSQVASGMPCCTKSSNMGWRYDLICIGAICITVFFLRFVVFNFRESPKYLLYKGQDEKAVKVLHQIAKFNHRESTISVEVFQALTADDDPPTVRDHPTPVLAAGTTLLKASWQTKVKVELHRYKLLFSSFAVARLTVLIWIT